MAAGLCSEFMCYAIPAKVVKVLGDVGLVDFGDGVEREVILAMVNARVGDYVLVHAGYAIQVLSEEEALQILEDYRRILELAEEGEEKG